MTIREAIASALDEEMERDESVFIMGESRPLAREGPSQDATNPRVTGGEGVELAQ